MINTETKKGSIMK